MYKVYKNYKTRKIRRNGMEGMLINYRDPNIVYFIGNSGLPINTAVGQIYKHIALGIIVDIRTSEIIDFHATLVSPIGKEFVKAQIIGRHIDRDLDVIIKGFERYQGPAQKALIVALRNAYDRYKNYMMSGKDNT